MTELKTLNDFECEDNFDICKPDESITFQEGKEQGYEELKEELKAEAIKWVKHYKQQYEESDEIDIKLAYDWMIYFFNLTEEDLEEADNGL